MSICVCAGALLSCPFGSTLAPLNVFPPAGSSTGAPMASIMDNIPYENILPFGMCSNRANPIVAAATAAAFGVLTPMPCVPVIPAPWTPGSPTVLVGGQPALTDSSTTVCIWGGVIKINMQGQSTAATP